jgi:hypothetical protein
MAVPQTEHNRIILGSNAVNLRNLEKAEIAVTSLSKSVRLTNNFESSLRQSGLDPAN